MKKNLVKSSKKLNDLYDKLLLYLKEIDYDHSDRILMNLYSKAWQVCTEATNDYRAIDYADYFLNGIEAAMLSAETQKPIYVVFSTEEDAIFYFVEDLPVIMNLFKQGIKEAESHFKDANVDVKSLEYKILKLKKKKK